MAIISFANRVMIWAVYGRKRTYVFIVTPDLTRGPFTRASGGMDPGSSPG
ncbi:protein of unknown function [uncultured Sphingopyxis sp.]|uniref:Uncharacterized protein n=1 Tax=uncultured Sphingopyxis sp. TaxID=310581 RepID=A0A1Y5PMC6_9SPHN|nr:protein of unknown function [uncultured Sphingopyxis sp.]